MPQAPLMIVIHPVGTDVAPLTLDLTALQGESEGAAPAAAPGQEIAARPSGADEGGAPPSSPFGSVWMLVLIGVVIWFLIFAPERKARKQRDEMIGALKKGDKVITAGGLHGQVVEVRENEVTLKAHDTRLTFSKSSVTQVLGPKGDGDGSGKD